MCVERAKNLVAEREGPEHMGFAMAGFRLGLNMFVAITKRALAKQQIGNEIAGGGEEKGDG